MERTLRGREPRVNSCAGHRFLGEGEVCTKVGVNYVKPITIHTKDVPPCSDTWY